MINSSISNMDCLLLLMLLLWLLPPRHVTMIIPVV